MGQALEGRIAIVTGGARGQGRSHALALAAEGANLVVCDICDDIESIGYRLSTESELQQTVSAIEELGAKAVGVRADIRDPAQVQAVVDTAISAFGRLDILVANAGVCSFVPLADMTDLQWQQMIDVNLTGTFHCVRAALKPMLDARYGRIIITSSMSGRGGNPNAAHYSATKFGVIGLAKSVALEVATTGVTVNVVCPTSADTPMIHNEMTYRLFCPELEAPTIDDVRTRFAGLNPMGRPWLPPESFSRAVMFFASDPGTMTGTVLEVSAGISAGKP